jgi:acyl-CoA thioesterase-1
MRPFAAVLGSLGLVSLGLVACVDETLEEPHAPSSSARHERPRARRASSSLDAGLLGLADAGAGADASGLLGLGDASVPPPRDLRGKVVLHAGDSMVGGNGGLAKALGARFKAEGAKFYRDAEVAVSIRKYAQAPRFSRLLAHFKPDIVILTLGANDVFLPFPDYYATYVESIVKTVGERECWWVGPPTWKPDTGIVAVIQKHAGKCRFFDSSGLDISRAKDRIHPNDEGGEDWAGLFWAYFEGKGPAAPGLEAPAPVETDQRTTLQRGATLRIGGGT